MALIRSVLPGAFLALASLCSSSSTPHAVQIRFGDNDGVLQVETADYDRRSPRATLEVSNVGGSTVFLSSNGSANGLLLDDIEPYTRIAPGQTLQVDFWVDERPWRWDHVTAGSTTVSLEASYFYSGQGTQEAEPISAKEAPTAVRVDLFQLTLEYSTNCDQDGDNFEALACGGDDCNDVPEIGKAFKPGADEICDGRDQNCNGGIDEDAIDQRVWYLDLDGDTFGDPDTLTSACNKPGSDWVRNGEDCNDDELDIRPGVVDMCGDGIDNDCDGAIDDPVLDNCP